MRLKRIGSHVLIKATNLLITAGFVAWSATHVAGTIWHVAAPDTNLSAAGLISAAGLDVAQHTSADQHIDLNRLQSVFALAPTGQLMSSSGTTGAAMQAADTRLALTLKGAVASNDPARSRAIIASADRQEVYQAGDSLPGTPGSVVLQEIHPSYVLLNNNGMIETLRMDDVEMSVQASGPAGTPSSESEQGTAGDKSIMLPAGIDAEVALTDLVRIQPVFESADSERAGALRGLQIRHGSRQDFLAAVGLKQGDLITSVDGKALSDAADLPALMNQLSSQQVVSLQLLRDGEPVFVELDRGRW